MSGFSERVSELFQSLASEVEVHIETDERVITFFYNLWKFDDSVYIFNDFDPEKLCSDLGILASNFCLQELKEILLFKLELIPTAVWKPDYGDMAYQ